MAQHGMERATSYRSWWQPLPTWLKTVTLCGAYPAFLYGIYCILVGQEKSWQAIIAFGIFAFCTILHIVFDRRNRIVGGEYGRGIDFFNGND